MTLKRIYLVVSLVLLVSLLAACQPVNLSQLANSVPVSPEKPTAVTTPGGTIPPVTEATATVNTSSLRVRAEPSENAAVLTGIRKGEQYPVIGISSDGRWVQLAIDKVPGGTGWVSANFVTVEGPITDAAVTAVATAQATEAAPTATATVEAAMTEAATPAPGMAAVNTEGVRLRVRAQPSTEAEIVGYAYPGEVFPVEETSADGMWVKLGGKAGTENPDGGWVAAEFLVIGQ